MRSSGLEDTVEAEVLGGGERSAHESQLLDPGDGDLLVATAAVFGVEHRNVGGVGAELTSISTAAVAASAFGRAGVA